MREKTHNNMDFARIQHLVFDFDGTIADSYAAVTESINYALRRFGLRELSDDEVRPWVGTGLELILEHYAGKERVVEGVRLFREKYLTIYKQGTTLMPGAREMLDAINGRFAMALCSNKLGDAVRGLCDSLDIARHFKVILGANDVPNLKPHPDMLRVAMKRLGATSHDTLCVGDTTVDAEFAASCGVPCVLVLGGTGTRDELAAAKPVALLDNIAELPGLLL
jgi:phosphoglycolate phosphatase